MKNQRLTAVNNSTDAPSSVGTSYLAHLIALAVYDSFIQSGRVGRRFCPLFTSSNCFAWIRKLLCLLACIFFFQNSLADEIQNPVIIEFKYSVKGFNNYIIKIFQNGKVHYHENKIIHEKSTKAFTKPDSVPIDHYSQLTKVQLDELIVEFLSLPFKELPKYEAKRSFDLFFSLTISLKLYYVEMYVDNVLLYRALLTKLKKYISKDLSSWLCNPSEHDEDFIKSCEHLNFLPNDFKF